MNRPSLDEKLKLAGAMFGSKPSAPSSSAGPGIETDPTVPAWAKQPSKPKYTASEVGADVEGAASAALADAKAYADKQIAAIPTPDVSGQIGAHNVATDSHNDIRLLVQGLTDRLNALANSDDATLDQMSEIVAYIKANRGLIESVTTTKVNVSDIIDNLTTNVGDRPLSAAQGVALKQLIDAIKVPANVSAFANDAGYLTEVPSEYLTESQLFGVEAANMPQGFTQLQYIESTGQQFVNTEYYPSGGKLRVVLKFMYVREHNGLSLFGSSSGAPFSMTVYGYYPTFYVGGSSNIFCGEESSLNTLYTLDATADNGTLTAVWNGVAFSKAYSGDLRTSSPFYVFGASANVETGNGYRFYSMKIYDSDELVRDFFPCMSASGEYGLYDDKNAVFYRNNGGGEFVGGPAVSVSVPIERGGTGADNAADARSNLGAAPIEHTHSQYLTAHQDLSAYAKKSEIPTVPTNVSAFTNDAGYARKSELTTAMFAMEVDADGNLYAVYEDEGKVPSFELGSDGSLYYIIEE